MTEAQIENQILEILNKKGIFAFKFKDNTRSVNGHHRKGSSWQINGVSDIAAIITVNSISITVWMEVKTLTGIQSRDQKAFEKKIKDSGGFYFIVRSKCEAIGAINEVERKMGEYKRISK